MVEGSVPCPAESGLSLAGPRRQREQGWGTVRESGVPSYSESMANWFLNPYAFWLCSEPVLSSCVSFPRITELVVSPSLCSGSQDNSASKGCTRNVPASLPSRRPVMPASQAVCRTHSRRMATGASLRREACQTLSPCSRALAPGVPPPTPSPGRQGLSGQGRRLWEVLWWPCLRSPDSQTPNPGPVSLGLPVALRSDREGVVSVTDESHKTRTQHT